MRGIIATFALGLASCAATSPGSPTCTECAPGSGAVRVALAVTVASVARVTATVTAPDIASPITLDLAIAGSPPVASGTIPDIPSGANRLVTLESYAAAPEETVVIYRGSATTSVAAGQVSTLSITLRPVVKDVAVTATFPTGDVDVARIDHVAVTVSGARITGSATWYLVLDPTAGTASGTAAGVPVGASLTVTVQSFDAGGVLLHSGSAETAVVEGVDDAVTVALANQGGGGSIGVIGGFCNPDCTARVCGDDGCGGTCGGCQPGATCVAGACVAQSTPPPDGTWTTALLVPESPESVWVSGLDDVWVGTRGSIRHWDGGTWSSVGTGAWTNAMWGSAANDLWGAGCDAITGVGVILHWDGSAWSTLSADTSLTAIFGTGANDVWAAGYGTGNALHWNGSAWSNVPIGTPYIVNGLWGSAPDDYWAVGQTGLILHWDGAAWSSFSVETTTYLWAVWGSGPGDVWAVGNHSESGVGLILHWDGSAWSSTQVGDSPYYSVWGSGPKDIWVGSTWGSAARHWDGSAWSSVSTGVYSSVQSLSGSGASDVWGVGWNPGDGVHPGVILHYAP